MARAERRDGRQSYRYFQAANTSLTGGSTPWGDDYDRDIVLVSLRRRKGIHLIDGGRQVVCLPGATLDALEKALRPLGREPHSVIGSSCIGASVLGGICDNSGGADPTRARLHRAEPLRRGLRGRLGRPDQPPRPAARQPPREILARVERGDLPAPEPTDAWASDRDYVTHVRDTDTDTPARFNATRDGCAKSPAVPASSRSSPCGSTPSRPKRRRRSSTSAPMTPTS